MQTKANTGTPRHEHTEMLPLHVLCNHLCANGALRWPLNIGRQAKERWLVHVRKKLDNFNKALHRRVKEKRNKHTLANENTTWKYTSWDEPDMKKCPATRSFMVPTAKRFEVCAISHVYAWLWKLCLLRLTNYASIEHWWYGRPAFQNSIPFEGFSLFCKFD